MFSACVPGGPTSVGTGTNASRLQEAIPWNPDWVMNILWKSNQVGPGQTCRQLPSGTCSVLEISSLMVYYMEGYAAGLHRSHSLSPRGTHYSVTNTGSGKIARLCCLMCIWSMRCPRILQDMYRPWSRGDLHHPQSRCLRRVRSLSLQWLWME